MSLSVRVLYQNPSQFSFDASLMEMGSYLQLKDLGGGTYSTANPHVDSQFQFPVSAITSISPESSGGGTGDDVRICFLIDGVLRWYDGATWKNSDGSYDQANSLYGSTPDYSAIIADLGLITGVPFNLGFRVIHHSADGTTFITLHALDIGATFVTANPVPISECSIYCYLSDLLGDVPTYDATKPIRFNVKNSRAFFHGTKLIQPFTKSAAFNSSGYMELSIIETATPGEYLQFFLTYYEGSFLKSIKLVNAIVPNTPNLPLTQITTTKDTDF